MDNRNAAVPVANDGSLITDLIQSNRCLAMSLQMLCDQQSKILARQDQILFEIQEIRRDHGTIIGNQTRGTGRLISLECQIQALEHLIGARDEVPKPESETVVDSSPELSFLKSDIVRAVREIGRPIKKEAIAKHLNRPCNSYFSQSVYDLHGKKLLLRDDASRYSLPPE